MSELKQMFFTWMATDFPSIILLLALVFTANALTSWHRADGPFDFRKALLDPVSREISFSRLGHFVCLIISTAIMCYEAMKGRLSEWLFIGYMTAWAGTYVAAKAIDAKTTEPLKPIERRQTETEMPIDKERRKPLQPKDDAQ